MQNRAGAGVEQKWEKIGAGAEPPHWFPPDVYHLYLDEVEGRCGILSGPAAHLSQVSSAHPQRNIGNIITRPDECVKINSCAQYGTVLDIQPEKNRSQDTKVQAIK